MYMLYHDYRPAATCITPQQETLQREFRLVKLKHQNSIMWSHEYNGGDSAHTHTQQLKNDQDCFILGGVLERYVPKAVRPCVFAAIVTAKNRHLSQPPPSPYRTQIKQLFSLSPLYRWRDWGPEKEHGLWPTCYVDPKQHGHDLDWVVWIQASLQVDLRLLCFTETYF